MQIGVDYVLQQSDEQYQQAVQELDTTAPADEDEGFEEEVDINVDDGTVAAVNDIFTGPRELVDPRTGYLVMQEKRPSRRSKLLSLFQ